MPQGWSTASTPKQLREKEGIGRKQEGRREAQSTAGRQLLSPPPPPGISKRLLKCPPSTNKMGFNAARHKGEAKGGSRQDGSGERQT